MRPEVDVIPSSLILRHWLRFCPQVVDGPGDLIGAVGRAFSDRVDSSSAQDPFPRQQADYKSAAG
jgi:hypothetical protein